MSRFHIAAGRLLVVACTGLGAAGTLAAAGLVMPVASDYLWRTSWSGGSAISTVSPPLVRASRALPQGRRPRHLLLIAEGVAVCTPVTGRA